METPGFCSDDIKHNQSNPSTTTARSFVPTTYINSKSDAWKSRIFYWILLGVALFLNILLFVAGVLLNYYARKITMDK